MADGDRCKAVRGFGGEWYYRCPETLPLVTRNKVETTPAAEPQKSSKEREGQYCHYVRSGGDYFEVCAPKDTAKQPASGTQPPATTPSIWSTISDWLEKALSSPSPQRAMFHR